MGLSKKLTHRHKNTTSYLYINVGIFLTVEEKFYV